MTDKHLITPNAIREGDSIRFEYDMGSMRIGHPAAVEYVASQDWQTWNDGHGEHFLLARPKVETYVQVPQSAIDALVQANEAAFDITARTQEDWERKNELRLDAIIGFLDTIGVDY